MKDRNKGYFGVFLILVSIMLGIWQWSIRSANMIQVNVLSTEANNLSVEGNKLSQRAQILKAVVSAGRQSVAQQIELVFPAEEELTDITRLFDDFEHKNNFESNPFLISSISYLSISEEDSYRVLPMSIQMTASKKNFLKFVDFIENSGSLESEVRLMSIEDLSIGYPDTFGGAYTISATVNAYFASSI